MADIKHTFTGGKMNKDLDERLVPNGEYRDAMNIQVRTTDGDAAGAIQNIRGNIEVGSAYDETWMNAVGIYSKNAWPTCIASIADEKKDNAYFLFASPVFNTNRYRVTSYTEKQVYIDSILEHRVKSRITSPVVVDCYAVIQLGENLFGANTNPVGAVLGSSWNEIRVKDITNIRVGMTIKAYIYDDATQEETELFTQSGGTTPVIKAISPAIVLDDNETTGYSILLSEDVTVTDLSGATHFLFEDERVLKFDNIKPDGSFFYNITGISIIDNLLFWTDNKNEPKKINIDRCKAGSMVGDEVVDSDFSTNTRLMLENPSTNELVEVSEFDEYLDINPVDIYLKEKHITVIRKAPTKALSIIMRSSSRPNNAIIASGLTFVDSNFQPLGFNAEISFTDDELLNSSYRKDDILVFTQLDNDGNVVISPIQIKGKFVCYADSEGNETLEPTDTMRFKLLFGNPGVGFLNQMWKIELDQKDPYFELKMARFAYRYKYEDGEYSSFSPWSRIAFLPGVFEYSSNQAYNLGMTNTIRELTLVDFIPYNKPKDVVAIDILYKTTDSPNVYVVDTIAREKNPEWDLFTPSAGLDDISTGKLTITSEMIHRVLPDSQVLRSWDNVPRKALSQEIVGNRLLYGNYVQGYDFKNTVGLIQTIMSLPIGNLVGTPSIKSLRDYKVGMVFGDKYGRETPVITSGYSLEMGDGNYSAITGDITVEKLLSPMSNKFELLQDWTNPNNTNVEPPSWLKDGGYVKYYVKETSNEYYNLVMDRWYDAGDDTIWLSFNSADRNKVDEETYLILKNVNGSNVPVLDKARYKIIAIENEAPDYISTEKLFLGEIQVTAANTGFSMWPNQSNPDDTGNNTTNIETDSDPIGLYNDDVSSETNSPHSLSIDTTSWDDSPLGNSSSDQGVFGRNIPGRVEMRVVARDNNFTTNQVELATSWRTLSHYSSTPSFVKFVWSKLFNSSGNGGGNLYTQALNNTLISSSNLEYYVQFQEIVVSKKPEFDGKFFVKIHKDASIRQWIMNLFGGGNFTYESVGDFSISYIDQQQNNGTVQEMQSFTAPDIWQNDVEIDVSQYASAEFGTNDDNSSTWFAGKWQGVTDYWIGDEVAYMDNSWVNNPTWHSGNRLAEWREELFGDDKPLFGRIPDGEPLSSTNTILEGNFGSGAGWVDSETPCNNIIEVFGMSGYQSGYNDDALTYNADGDYTNSGFGSLGTRCYDTDRLRVGASQSALWNGGWAGKDGTSLSYAQSAHDFWYDYRNSINSSGGYEGGRIFLDGAWATRYNIDSNYVHVRALESGYFGQYLGGWTNFGGSTWASGTWVEETPGGWPVQSALTSEDFIVPEEQTSPIKSGELSLYKSEVFTQGAIIHNGVKGASNNTNGNPTMGRMSISTMARQDGQPFNEVGFSHLVDDSKLFRFANDPTESVYAIIWSKVGLASNYTVPSVPNEDFYNDTFWSGWDAPVGKLSVYWMWIRTHYAMDLEGRLSINAWVQTTETTNWDPNSASPEWEPGNDGNVTEIRTYSMINPFTIDWEYNPQNDSGYEFTTSWVADYPPYDGDTVGYTRTKDSIILGGYEESDFPLGHTTEEYDNWGDAYFIDGEAYQYPMNQYLITNPYNYMPLNFYGGVDPAFNYGSFYSSGTFQNYYGPTDGINNIIDSSNNILSSYYGSPTNIPPAYTCRQCTHTDWDWHGIGLLGSNGEGLQHPSANYVEIENDYFMGEGWDYSNFNWAFDSSPSWNIARHEQPIMSFVDDEKPACLRYVAQVEFRKVDQSTNMVTTEGLDLSVFDPRAYLKHDGGTSIQIEIIDIFPVYEEEGNTSFSELGACWETEPRENVDLDLYYEASSAMPIVLDRKNALDFCPINSIVSIERADPNGSINQVQDSGSPITVDNVHFLNKSIIVELSRLTADGNKQLIKDGILIDDKIKFQHPDGTQTKSQILSYYEPISESTATGLYYTSNAFGSTEISGGISDWPRSFRRVSSRTIEIIPGSSTTIGLISTNEVQFIYSTEFLTPGTIIESITQNGNPIPIPQLTTIVNSIYAVDGVYLSNFTNTQSIINNGLDITQGFTMTIMENTGYYEIDADVWQYPVIIPWFNCYSFGNGVESDRIRDDFNAPQIDNGVKVSTTFSGYGEERISSGMIYSGLYNSTSEVNDLNEFNMSQKITKDLNPSYGSIQRLKTRDTDVVVFTEDKVLKVLANKDALFNADGNTQLTASDRVLGTAVPFVGDYGISKNPESLAWDQYRMYFADKQRGAVLRLSRDGLTPISNVGMKTWFRDNLLNANLILGTFDIVSGEYNITIKESVIDSSINNSTVSFNEAAKGWVSFKSFIPSSGVSVSGKYITTNKNKIWEHHIPEFDNDGITCSNGISCVDRNNFYNVGSIDSSVEILFNDLPSVVKSFKTVDYEGSQARVMQELEDNEYYNLVGKDGWWASSINTDLQEGSLNEFIDKEGKWFNNINGLKTTVINLDTKEFTVQGIGTVGSVEEPVTEENDQLDIEVIEGCMDEAALNYSATANTDDGSCCYVGGCTTPQALNYNPSACFDDGSCEYTVYGCMDENASNYNAEATNSCWWGCCEYDNDTGVLSNDGTTTVVTPEVYGCTDDQACNYNANATINQVSAADVTNPCEYTSCQGCTDPAAFNYNAGDDGLVLPCVDAANVPNGYSGGCCEEVIMGCTDEAAGNYNPNANVDDGGCTYPQPATLTVQQDTVPPYNPLSVNTWNEDNSQGEIIEGENDWNEFINY